ncbi:MAG: mono/diheme cytochrome c family protein [Gammaproteobacteria bacterium]|jgi:mono/diheme cytochrome c family protein
MGFSRKAFHSLGSVISRVLLAAAVCALASSATAQSLGERGSYLVNSILVCGNCHMPQTAAGKPIAQRNLSGGLAFTTPAFNARASNITPDSDTGIGSWSDAQIKRALRKGLRPGHGRLSNTAGAVMPIALFKAIVPRNLDAIVTYLRSVTPARDGRRLEPPMAFQYYDRLTDADLDAIVTYLRTVPPLE